jgi:hypothetical protein
MLELEHPNLVRSPLSFIFFWLVSLLIFPWFTSKVQMIGVAVQQPPWLVVMEFMEYGDLKGVLEVTHSLPDSAWLSIVSLCCHCGADVFGKELYLVPS